MDANMIMTQAAQAQAGAAQLQAGAAVVQALLTVGAVYLAGRISDRSQGSREAGARRERHEAAAAVARQAHTSYSSLLKEAPVETDGDAFRRMVAGIGFEAILRMMERLPLAEMDQVVLDLCVKLEARLGGALADFENTAKAKAAFGNPLGAKQLVANHDVEVFNAAAGIERRVAEMHGRAAAL